MITINAETAESAESQGTREGNCLRAMTLFLAVLASSPAAADTGFVDRTVTVEGQPHRYQVYVPADYAPDQSWPVIVDLHGNGAQGSDGIRQTAHFLADQIRLDRRRFPLIAVFPQAAPDTTWSDRAMEDLVMAETDATIAEFHGDDARVYLTGFSMGGDGVYEIAARWPRRFAALVAIAGPVPSIDGLVKQIRGIPIRVFHGDADERVPVGRTRELVEALKRTGANVRYTEYPDTRHGPSAERAYAEQNLIPWLLAQRRQAR